MTTKLRVGILASTNGTILPAIVTSDLPGIDFVVFVTDKPACGARAKAEAFGIPTIAIENKGKSRQAWGQECISALEDFRVDLVILVGFMRILSADFVQRFAGRILNVHPSLLPKFGGGMNLDVHQAVIDAKETETGATIHLVSEAVDEGEILLQESIPILPDESAESLKKRVQALEAKLYPHAIRLMQERLTREQKDFC